MRRDGKPERITVLETKGDHLDNVDTDYKRELLSFLSSGRWQKSMEIRDGLPLSEGDLPAFHHELVLMRDWKARLPRLLRDASPARVPEPPRSEDPS